MRKYIIIALFLTIFFGGLNDIKEITDLALVYAVGIDYEEGEYKLSVVVINTTSKSEDSKNKMYVSSGASIEEACANIIDESTKKLYLAHMESLILSEKVTKERMLDIVDFFMRSKEGTNRFYIFLANDCSSNEIIKYINEEDIDTTKLIKSSNKYKGDCSIDRFSDNLKELFKPGLDIVLNSMKIENGKISIGNMAYIKDKTFSGYLEQRDNIIYNLLENNLFNVTITLGDYKDRIVSEIISSKFSIKLKDGVFEISGKADVNISEIGEDAILNSDTAKELSKVLKADIERFVNNCIDLYDADLLGFGNLMYRKKDDRFLNEIYMKNIEYNVDVKVTIVNQGGVILK